MTLHAALAGADLHAPSNYLVENDTGITITALTVCTFNGIGTTFPSVVPITSSGQTIRGVALTNILATSGSNIGYITGLGFMIGVNTSAWAEGTKLFSNNAGGLVTTPTGPLVATVYKQDAVNGWLFIEGPAGSGSGGGGDVVGPPSSTNQAIAVWDGTTGQLLEDGPGTNVQPSGAIAAQGFITDQDVTGTVTVGANQTWVAPSLTLTDTGVIDLSGGGTLILVD
jgi:hypothetical protein